MSDTPKLYQPRVRDDNGPEMAAPYLPGYMNYVEEPEYRKLERENAALRAKLEEATKNAERYRHLRDHGGADLFGGTASMSIGKHPMIVYFAPSLNRANMIPLFAENADYMVDAAIAQGRGEK